MCVCVSLHVCLDSCVLRIISCVCVCVLCMLRGIGVLKNLPSARSFCLAGVTRGFETMRHLHGGVTGGRRKAKIPHEVKGTGARKCSENNRKLVIGVWPPDLAHLTQWTVGAAAVIHSSFKALSAPSAQFASKPALILRVTAQLNQNTQTRGTHIC